MELGVLEGRYDRRWARKQRDKLVADEGSKAESEKTKVAELDWKAS